MAKHQPAGAFGTKTLTKAPETDTHPLAPRRGAPQSPRQHRPKLRSSHSSRRAWTLSCCGG